MSMAFPFLGLVSSMGVISFVAIQLRGKMPGMGLCRRAFPVPWNLPQMTEIINTYGFLGCSLLYHGDDYFSTPEPGG
jgi:hypothetical protein